MATATAPTITLAGLSAASRLSAGKSAAKAIDISAEEEELAAREREVVRRHRLLSTLGAINANAAAGGIAREGSVANLRTVSTTNAERNIRSDRLRTEARKRSLASQRRATKARAALGVADAFLGL